ncbi:odorant receptor 131-2-like [Rana temporaria]|uniref:odorant receptor 131-2-like n=1 Tax=Rana temporaria TaxID=8407 RepID=UPI001AAD4A19|nr:odorant receptor 131-2-like [Rana temporaria]
MNNTTEENNNTDSSLHLAKATFYLLDFLVCCFFTILITQTIWRDSALKKEVRFFLLCQHFMCLTFFFLTGTIFYFLRALRVNAPAIVCWIIFAVQITIGRGVLISLALMALNTCIAICWPLHYEAFAHSVKRKIVACLWIISLFDPTISVIYEIIAKGPKHSVQLDPSCPTTLSGLLPRVAGIVFLIILVSLIIGSYVAIYREGKRAGHFTKNNKNARRTIFIHGLQTALHIIPTFLVIALRKENTLHLMLDLVSFIIFSFAQCASPIVYGLRCKELRDKFLERYLCHVKQLSETENNYSR